MLKVVIYDAILQIKCKRGVTKPQTLDKRVSRTVRPRKTWEKVLETSLVSEKENTPYVV